METDQSRKLAGLVGPILGATALSEMLNPQIWTEVTAPQTYLSGMLFFIAGFLLVRSHNRWTWRWPVLITLIGWFGVIGGLGRMFATKAAMQSAQIPSVAFAEEAALLIAASFLTLKSWTTKRRSD